MKKVLLLLLALICVFTLVSCKVTLFAGNFHTSTVFTFELEPDGKSYAIASGAWHGIFENRGDIKIPNSHTTESKDKIVNFTKGFPVTRIADRGFQQEKGITSVTIPTSIKSIGSYAFSGCTSLATINFKGTVVQWKAIEKGNHWNQDVPATEVICSDGTVSLI